MLFLIINSVTKRLYYKPGEFCPARYESLQGARIGLSFLAKRAGNEKYEIITSEEYQKRLDEFDPLVPVYNNITGDGKTPIYIRRSEVGGCSDPSSERYHSM